MIITEDASSIEGNCRGSSSDANDEIDGGGDCKPDSEVVDEVEASDDEASDVEEGSECIVGRAELTPPPPPEESFTIDDERTPLLTCDGRNFNCCESDGMTKSTSEGSEDGSVDRLESGDDDECESEGVAAGKSRCWLKCSDDRSRETGSVANFRISRCFRRCSDALPVVVFTFVVAVD